MSEAERAVKERALEQEIYQLKMKILDFKANDSDQAINLPACEARLVVLQKQLADLA
jgi:hypothetical protein